MPEATGAISSLIGQVANKCYRAVNAIPLLSSPNDREITRHYDVPAGKYVVKITGDAAKNYLLRVYYEDGAGHG